MKDFEEQSLNLAGRGYNGGNGLKLSEVLDFMTHNAEEIRKLKELTDFCQQLAFMLKEMDTFYISWNDNVSLSTFCAVNEDVSCAYGVLKDT